VPKKSFILSFSFAGGLKAERGLRRFPGEGHGDEENLPRNRRPAKRGKSLRCPLVTKGKGHRLPIADGEKSCCLVVEKGVVPRPMGNNTQKNCHLGRTEEGTASCLSWKRSLNFSRGRAGVLREIKGEDG